MRQKKYKLIFSVVKHLYRMMRGYGWYGNYATWDQAKEKTFGYNDEIIHSLNLKSTMRVINGEGKYVRDGVVFNDCSYDFHILSFVFDCCFFSGANKLNLVDFGGNYASFYIKNKSFIDRFSLIDYRVIELSELVEKSGPVANNFRGLSFYSNLLSATTGFDFEYSILLFSGVLGYVDDYTKILSDTLKCGFEYVFVDRTLVTSSSKDRICIQKVHPSIVRNSSYPCRIISQNALVELFQLNKYELVFSDDLTEVDDYRFSMKYFVFKRM